MSRKIFGVVLIGGLSIALLFNNCASEHTGQSSSEFSILNEIAFSACAFTDEMDLFGKTYHPFVTSRCANCHVPGGEGKGAFASSGLLVAYNAFTVVGYNMVSEFAVNAAHKPPYTGLHNQTQVDLLKQQWVKGLENIQICKNGGGPVDPNPVDESKRIMTKSKGINAPANGVVSISWDLISDLLDKGEPHPDLPGARLSLNVARINLGPKSVYQISLPSVKGSTSTDLKIRSLLVALNGRIISNQTTFRYIDEGVYKATDKILAPGAMIIDGPISSTDVISISIGELSPANLPQPPTLPRVSFELDNQSVPERDEALVNIVLSSPFDQYVSVTVDLITVGSNLAKNRRSQRITNNNNMTVDVDRWDWDFSIDSQVAVFQPGETKRTLTLKIAPDQRHEPNEVIRLSLGSTINGVKSPTHSTTVITIIDDDAPHVGTAPTFSQLMQNDGILFKNCIECHNSVDNRGGYNLSDYNLMISSGVLVPGNASSKMFVRMNSQVEGIRPMPLNGLLDSTLRRQVERWILDGAKNN